jgi:hypothetical protein
MTILAIVAIGVAAPFVSGAIGYGAIRLSMVLFPPRT